MTIVEYIELTWETLTPFAIADPHDHSLVDRPIVVDGSGAPEVPANGLIGSLRDHLAEYAHEVLGELRDNETTPSNLRALGTQLELGDTGITVRGQSKIDRRRGAAEASSLRTSEMVNPGATLTLWCEYDGEVPDRLLGALSKWQPTLGGGVGTGMGQTLLKCCKTGKLDLDETDDLERYLDGVSPSSFGSLVKAKDISVEERPVHIRARAHIVDGLFIGGATPSVGEAGERNVTPSYARTGDTLPTIEGSSIRGVLRANVARIASTIVNIRKGDLSDDDVAEAGDNVADALFGSPAMRGLVAVDGSHIVGIANDDSEQPPPLIEERMHVGIDRFTGGAKPHLLFGESVVVSGSFDITIRPLTKTIPDWATALIAAALRDIDDGLDGFGGRTSRGLGTVRLGEVAINLDDALPLKEEIITAVTKLASAPAVEDADADKTDISPNIAENSESEGPHDPGHEPCRSQEPRSFVEVGELGWEELHERCVDLTAYWHDLDGAHIGPLTKKPRAVGSHLWAWDETGDRLLRARVDGHRCYVAELVPPDGDGTNVTTVTLDQGLAWVANSGQLPQSGRRTIETVLNGLDIWLIATASSAPVTFVKLGCRPFAQRAT